MFAATVLSLALSQPQDVVQPPSTQDDVVQPIVKEEPAKPVDNYDEMCRLAVRANRKLVVFVGIPKRGSVAGLLNARTPTLAGFKSGDIVVCSPDGNGWLTWERTARPTATDREILGLGVSRAAVPFERAPFQEQVNAERDDSPWLSRAETETIKKVWPTSVPFGNLKFYKLRPLYQQMYSMNSVPYNDPVPLDGEVDPDLFVSGGLRDVHGWRSVKGLDLPGKIKVWKENADVRAFVLVPRWRWEFPNGTVAYDVLLNDDGKPFEIRTATKEDGAWVHKVAFKDKDAAPVGFAGAGRACASCHDKAALIRDVPGRIYRHSTWGDDNRFSWRPFDEASRLDRRWPIEE